MAVAFHKVVEDVSNLDLESKEELLHLCKKMIIEERREEIQRNIQEGEKEYKAGITKSFDNVDDLMKALKE